MSRRLPRNVVSATEFGRRREKQLARQIGARLHPASGAGRTKADMTIEEDETPEDDGGKRNPTVLELKTVPLAKSHTVQYKALYEALRQAERIGGEAMYVIEFKDIKLVGKVVRR